MLILLQVKADCEKEVRNMKTEQEKSKKEAADQQNQLKAKVTMATSKFKACGHEKKSTILTTGTSQNKQ